MSIVRSVWSPAPIALSGVVGPAWNGAGAMALAAGRMLVKNDNQFLYITLDLTGDNGNSPGTNDYFWLTFDVDGNHGISPNVDLNYAIYPSLPIRIGRQKYLGANTWTGLLTGPTTSHVVQGFGASPSSATAHRIWEMRIALSEIGINLATATAPPVIGFGLRTASSTPSFVHNEPADFSSNFSHLNQLVLSLGPSTYPSGTAGVVIGGVGLIPATQISAGRATTAASYIPHVENAAFGGSLNLIGNSVTLASLYAAGARSYRVLHSLGGGAATPVRQWWSNYHWTGATYALENFGPDVNDRYPLPNPADDYSIKDLLLQWNSASEPDGSHSFHIEFHDAAGAVVASPAQTLTILTDNTPPDVRILSVSYKGANVTPCMIVTVTPTPDPVSVQIRAYDAAGNLLSYALNAYYGDNQIFSPALASVGYPGGNWQGTTGSTITAPVSPVKFPPVTCAYQLRLSATMRVTNGYSYIGYIETNDHITFIVS